MSYIDVLLLLELQSLHLTKSLRTLRLSIFWYKSSITQADILNFFTTDINKILILS